MTQEEEIDLLENWNDDSWKVLAERNMRLGVHLANKWHGTGLDPDDLFSIALMGITKAAKAFKPELGNKFATFAGTVINNEILMEIRRQKKHKHVLSYSHPLVQEKTGDFFMLEDILQDPVNVEDKVEVLQVLDAVEQLPELERKIISLRKDGYGQMEISTLLGCSQANVSRREKAAKNKLRKIIAM